MSFNRSANDMLSSPG